MLRMLKVSGESMLPRFREGDYVLVSRLPILLGRIQIGDIVAFRQREHGTMIKSVVKVLDGSRYQVLGTHPQSVDSRRFGPVTKGDLIGRVVWHLKKPAGKRVHRRVPATSKEDNQ